MSIFIQTASKVIDVTKIVYIDTKPPKPVIHFTDGATLALPEAECDQLMQSMASQAKVPAGGLVTRRAS